MEDFRKVIQEASGYLRKAENNMFSGKNREAVELLISADEYTEKAAQQNPEDYQVKSLRQKIEKIRKDLERKGISTRPGSGNGLPFEVEAQLGHIRESVLTKNLERAKRELDLFHTKFAGSYTNIPQLHELQTAIAGLEKEAEADAALKSAANQSRAEVLQQNEALCRKWEDEFRSIPYFNGTARNVPGLLLEKQYYQKARETVERYSTEVFQAEKSITLESLARDVSQRIHDFEANMAETLAEMAGEITESIEESIDMLNHDTAWLHQPELKPHFTGRRELESFEARIDEIARLFDKQDPPFEKLKHTYARLQSMNDERKTARSKRIHLRPAVLDGPDAADAVKAAESALQQNQPGIKILKAAVVKPWENKHSENWLDNTRTQWVVRKYQETVAELAAQFDDGSCRLYCMNVERDINADGSFGKITSHVMYDEVIAYENIS